MKLWKLVMALSAALVLWQPQEARAQRLFRIASLNTGEQFATSFEGFKVRMTELGYAEGRNVRYDFRNAKGSDEVLLKLAYQLVQDKVDLIVTTSTTATVAAAKATAGTDIPVVFLSSGNAQILVKSFASSGSNLAGISSASMEVTGKRFELLRELAPWVKRIAVFNNPAGVNYKSITTEVGEAAKKLGYSIREIKTTGLDEIARAVPTVTRQVADAIFGPPDALITEATELIVQQSIKERLPVITSLAANVNKGCLATYAADYASLGRQGAVLVDKIFKGIKPTDLPVEFPEKLNLVINLKTAKAIGLKIPKDLLLRADEVIE